MNAWSEPAAPPPGGVASVRLKSSGWSHGRWAAGNEPGPPGSSPRSTYSRKAAGRYGSSTSAELQLLCTSQSITRTAPQEIVPHARPRGMTIASSADEAGKVDHGLVDVDGAALRADPDADRHVAVAVVDRGDLVVDGVSGV